MKPGNPKLCQEALKETIRRNLWSFCLYYDPAFFGQRPFLKQVADALMRIDRGEIKTLAVSMPPRAGKSYLVSLFCAWWLARHPQNCVMRNTVTSALYRKFSYDVRDMIKNPKYQSLFPTINLQPDKQNIDGWSLTLSKQGAYFGGGVGSNIIGFGANLAITDDLYSGFAQALSVLYQEQLKNWKQGSHNSRMEKDCPEIYIGTRWSKTDAIGQAVEAGNIDCVIVIPALILNSNGYYRSFCENVKSTDEYLKIKSETDMSIWDAEYQQEPSEVKGALFNKEQLNYFKFDELPDVSDGVLSYVDVADEGEDFFCQAMGSVYQGRVYIPKVIFTQDNVDKTAKLCSNLIKQFRPEFTWVESNNQGSVFIKMLRNMVPEDCSILPDRAVTNKITRIILASGLVKKYFVFLDESQYRPDSEYAAFMKNIFSFNKAGGNKHDDAPDCISGLCKVIQTNLPDLFEGYQEDPPAEEENLEESE